MSHALSRLVRQLKRAYELVSEAVFWLGLQADRIWTWSEIARIVHREGNSRLMYDPYAYLRFPTSLAAA